MELHFLRPGPGSRSATRPTRSVADWSGSTTSRTSSASLTSGRILSSSEAMPAASRSPISLIWAVRASISSRCRRTSSCRPSAAARTPASCGTDSSRKCASSSLIPANSPAAHRDHGSWAQPLPAHRRPRHAARRRWPSPRSSNPSPDAPDLGDRSRAPRRMRPHRRSVSDPACSVPRNAVEVAAGREHRWHGETSVSLVYPPAQARTSVGQAAAARALARDARVTVDS